MNISTLTDEIIVLISHLLPFEGNSNAFLNKTHFVLSMANTLARLLQCLGYNFRHLIPDGFSGILLLELPHFCSVGFIDKTFHHSFRHCLSIRSMKLLPEPNSCRLRVDTPQGSQPFLKLFPCRQL